MDFYAINVIVLLSLIIIQAQIALKEGLTSNNSHVDELWAKYVTHRISERGVPKSIFSILKDQPKTGKKNSTSEIDFAKVVPDDKIAEETRQLQELSDDLAGDEIGSHQQKKVIQPTSATSSEKTDYGEFLHEEVVGDILKANNNNNNNGSKVFQDDYDYVDDDYGGLNDEEEGGDIDGLYDCPRRTCNFRGRCLASRVGDEIFCACRSGFMGTNCETDTNGIIIWLLASIVCLLMIGIALLIMFKFIVKSSKTSNNDSVFQNFQLTPTGESQ